jgi:hypothetical protein
MHMDNLPPQIQKAATALLTGRAHTTPQLRQAVEAYAAGLGGARRSGQAPVPEILVPYLKKLALHAYKITLSAALGAGLARVERGLAALKGDR